MTEITKAYTRRTRAPFMHYRKKIVVTLEPDEHGRGDFISLRLERVRHEGLIYRVSIDDLYALLVRKAVQNKQLEKARSKIGKYGRRVKRK